MCVLAPGILSWAETQGYTQKRENDKETGPGIKELCFSQNGCELSASIRISHLNRLSGEMIGPFPCYHTVWDTPECTPPHLCEGRCSVYRTVITLHRFYTIAVMNNWTWLGSFSFAEVAALLLLTLRLTATLSSMYNKFLWHWQNGANFSKTAGIILVLSLFYNVTEAGSAIYQVKGRTQVRRTFYHVFYYLDCVHVSFCFPTTKISPILIKIKYLEDQFMLNVSISIYLRIQDAEWVYGYVNSLKLPVHAIY